MAGCGPTEQDRVDAAYTLAQTNPPGARAEIVKQWNAKGLTIDACINLAHDRLDQNRPGAPGFALATLQAAADLEADAVRHGVNEFYWFRVGTLAGKGAAVAFNNGDTPGARALVLAGPARWQEENYWRFHPDHDALASLVMHRSGESNAAVQRLRGRPDLDEQALAVLNQIEAEVAAAARAKQQKKK